MSSGIRVGLVPYLNAKPFHYGLREIDPSVEIVEAEPSALPELVLMGEVDVALVPSVSLFFFPELKIIGRTCIAGEKEIRSVVLVLERNIREVRKVALDPASMTSSLLTMLILRERYALEVEFVRMNEPGSKDADACLFIGDRALRRRKNYLDLAGEWFELTRKPFVFAVWAGKKSGLGPLLSRAFLNAQKKLHIIASREARRLGLPVKLCQDYLLKVVRYELGSEELLGLRLFYSYLLEHNLVPDGYDLHLVDY